MIWSGDLRPRQSTQRLRAGLWLRSANAAELRYLRYAQENAERAYRRVAILFFWSEDCIAGKSVGDGFAFFDYECSADQDVADAFAWLLWFFEG